MGGRAAADQLIMATRRRRILRWIAAIIGAGIALIIAAVWWLTSSLVDSEQIHAARASAAFEEVRQRFPDVRPAFEISNDRLVVTRQPAAVSSSATATHLLVWQPREATMSRLRIPFWMARVATEPLPLETLSGIGARGLSGLGESRRRGNELNIRLADLQRYGPSLLLDGVTADGMQVLMWNE